MSIWIVWQFCGKLSLIHKGDKILQIPNLIKVPLEKSLPKTNENMYEILWASRLQIFEKLYEAGITDPLRLLAEFERFEKEYSMGVIHADDSEGASREFLSGMVVMQPRQTEAQSALKFEGRPVLQAVLDACDESVQCIVELGCGYGRNLIELQYHITNPDISLIGAEYTRSGRRAIEFFNARFFQNRPINVAFTNHSIASFPFIPRDKKVLVFSCHSLEQVRLLPNDFFIKLAGSADKITGIHIEPFGFQAVAQKDWQKTHLHHFCFAHHQSYNMNMFQCFQQAVAAQAIIPEKVSINASFAQPENPSSILIWRKP